MIYGDRMSDDAALPRTENLMTVGMKSERADKHAGSLTQRLAVVQCGSEAAGVGVHGHVRGRGVQQRVSDDDGVDDALAGDGVERRRGQVG